jgi:hypothetical protein
LNFTGIIDVCVEVFEHIKNSFKISRIVFHYLSQLRIADFKISKVKFIWNIPTQGTILLSAFQDGMKIGEAKEQVFVIDCFAARFSEEGLFFLL